MKELDNKRRQPAGFNSFCNDSQNYHNIQYNQECNQDKKEFRKSCTIESDDDRSYFVVDTIGHESVNEDQSVKSQSNNDLSSYRESEYLDSKYDWKISTRETEKHNCSMESKRPSSYTKQKKFILKENVKPYDYPQNMSVKHINLKR